MKRQEIIEHFQNVLNDVAKTEEGIYNLSTVKNRGIERLLTLVMGDSQSNINLGAIKTNTNLQIWGYVFGLNRDKEEFIDKVVETIKDNLYLTGDDGQRYGQIVQIMTITADVNQEYETKEYFVFQINCIIEVIATTIRR